MPTMMIEQGVLVRFKASDTVFGVGKVCGISTTGEAIIGRGIIIEIIKSDGIDPVTYPYTHMVVFENQIELILRGG